MGKKKYFLASALIVCLTSTLTSFAGTYNETGIAADQVKWLKAEYDWHIAHYIPECTKRVKKSITLSLKKLNSRNR
jgi:hypothetical protein